MTVALDVLGLIACLLVLVPYREKLPGEVVGLLSAISGFSAHAFAMLTSSSLVARAARR